MDFKFLLSTDEQNKIVHLKSDGALELIITKLKEYKDQNILFVIRDEQRLARFKENLKFFDPSLNIITIPSWDIQPYDRVSISSRNMAERTYGLFKALSSSKKSIILTSSASFIQRLPPKEIIKNSCLEIKVGQEIKRDEIVSFLIRNGFSKSSCASDNLEFALRGSIIDIVSNDLENGFRLDFFGDRLESVKLFDIITQVSHSNIDVVKIFPANEIIFNEDTIDLFRKKFLTQFGINATNDSLYTAIIENRRYPGMENWLPLFYYQLDNILDYTNPDLIVFDVLAKESINERIKITNDHYQSRLASISSKLEKPYYPVKPESLWITNLEDFIKNNPVIEFDNFIKNQTNTIYLQINKTPNLEFESRTFNNQAFGLLKKYQNDNPKEKILIACFSNGSKERMKHLLEVHNIHWINIDVFNDIKNIKGKTVGITLLSIENGFICDLVTIFTEQDLLGEKTIIKNKSKKKIENLLKEASNLIEGELVVHTEHGIGKFEKLETINVLGVAHDCLLIIYDGGDKLYLPVENIELISRYGSDQGVLDKLGSIAWQNRKAKLKNRIKVAAEHLLKLAAQRELIYIKPINPDKAIYEEFCARFAYPETEDQLNAIEDIKNDLLTNKPMDRLICGDVGFGKTEIALRAAFMVVFSKNDEKNQVAIVVPTTLLARQHYINFKKRFEGFNLKIKMLSRIISTKEAKEIKNDLSNGNIDIIIGTHALLAKNITFKNLNLLIIDEEQHFGVTQKEKLKELKAGVHVLSLSATPIPRTLQMSLTGIKELSLLSTPPVDRLIVKTHVMEYDQTIIREAILREHYRGGKIFYVCPHIKDLANVYADLKKMVPEIKIVIAHGQIPSNELDQIMNDFYDSKFNLLLSTTIIESGLDVADANTIFIHNADKLGLSQLYQLRGRVGRGKRRAYAYLIIDSKKNLSKIAKKRLQVMQNLDSLGVGFTIATHDMDNRGFGNLLGDEQSGHIKEVGIELYQKMLKDSVIALKAEKDNVQIKQNDDFITQLNMGLAILIPESYLADISLRLSLYQRIAELKDDREIENIRIELIDRFGPLPKELKNLLDLVSLKILCKKLNICKIETGPKASLISFYKDEFVVTEQLLYYINKNQNKIKIYQNHKLLLNIVCDDAELRMIHVREILENLLKNLKI